MRQDFFFLSPPTGWCQHNITRTERLQLLHSPTCCVLCLIVTFRAAVCGRWAYCLHHLVPCIVPCARAPLLFCTLALCAQHICIPLPQPCCFDCCVVLTRPLLSCCSRARVCVALCLLPCIDPRARPLPVL